MKTRKKAWLVFCIFAGMSAASLTQGHWAGDGLSGRVERQPEGSGGTSRTFSYQIDGEDGQDFSLDIAPVQRGEKEVMKLLAQAADEWETCYLGQNKSVNEVKGDLNVPAALCGGLVSVSLESSDYSILDTDGHLHTEQLEEQGSIVELRVTFSCQDYERIEEYALHVTGPEKGSREWLERQLQKKVTELERSSRTQTDFRLPETVGGHDVVWQEEKDSRWICLLLMGMAAAFCIEWRERENERKRKTDRNRQLMYEYPLMVDQLATLLDSGMTVRRAWERIIRSVPERQKKDRQRGPAYIEEMQITYREMKEGRGERDAYERFGSRIGLLPYRRIGSILSQNISKGTENLKALLQKESQEAFEMRKNQARKAGEEAGTRMLFPMMLMLLMLLLVLLFPAISNFGTGFS